MALPDLERIMLIESLISKATKMKNVGGYKAINEIVSFLRTYIIEGNPEPATLISPYIDTIKNPYIMTQIVHAGITEADIKIVEAQREPNRITIHNCIIHILETAQLKTSPTHKMISVLDAKNIFLNALDPDSTDKSYLEYLSGDHLEELRKARIIVADTDWVFHSLNLNGWEALLKNSNKAVSEMFTYFGTLTKEEKMYLPVALTAHKKFIIENFFANEIVNPGDAVSLNTAFAQIDEIAAPDLQKVLREGLSEKYFNLISFDKIKYQIKENIIKTRYTNLSANYITALAAQDPFVMYNVTQDFAGWMNCTITHPIVAPTICALEEKGISLKNITSVARIKAAVDIVDPQVVNSLSLLNQTLPLATVEEGTHYLDAFKTFMNCYMFNEISGACQTFWKTTENMIATAAEAVIANTATATNELINASTSSNLSLPSPTSAVAGTDLAASTHGLGAGANHDTSSYNPYVIIPAVAISLAALYGVCSIFRSKKRGYDLVNTDNNPKVEHAINGSDSPKHLNIVVRRRSAPEKDEGYDSDDSRTGLNPGYRYSVRR